jgi:hypothetical protein
MQSSLLQEPGEVHSCGKLQPPSSAGPAFASAAGVKASPLRYRALLALSYTSRQVRRMSNTYFFPSEVSSLKIDTIVP